MKKERGYCFAGITIDEMNPDNIALKNDFNHNLHLMFITIAPVLSTYFKEAKVLKAMCSHKMSIKSGKTSWIDDKFSSGEACTITYKDCYRERTILVLKELLPTLDEPYSFIVYENSFTMFKSSKPEILELVDGKTRTIFS
jgi:hypothetical protein